MLISEKQLNYHSVLAKYLLLQVGKNIMLIYPCLPEMYELKLKEILGPGEGVLYSSWGPSILATCVALYPLNFHYESQKWTSG